MYSCEESRSVVLLYSEPCIQQESASIIEKYRNALTKKTGILSSVKDSVTYAICQKVRQKFSRHVYQLSPFPMDTSISSL